ncbi:MAG: tripartite tricarboxylate transporter substrate binding protein [Burkholderiales bacterium]|jgi:tripartite-type tricarboxylate transporter receptor subunit TctC|nr:tripartite tricarboxylate transporter substrate binding protein [Burkholderiales bacterium]
MSRPVLAVSGACAIALSLAGALPVLAQDYPARSVRMVLPFPAGGGSDLVARIIAQKFSQQLGQQVIVDNRAGASGNIAADIVAKAPADGYTVFFANSSIAISPAIYKKLSYDPVNDFAAVSMASSYPFALVAHPALPVKSVKDLVALARAKPNSLDYSSAGTGTMSHMAMEMLRVKTGTRITHLPYKGAAPASVALLTGESQVAFVVMPVAAPHIRNNRLRGLGVADKARSAVVPELPTMTEAGVKDHIALQWNGLLVPAKTPAAVQDRLYREWVAAVKSPEVVKRIRAEGAEPSGNSPAEFSAFFRSELAKWADVAKQSGTTVD